MPNFTAHSEAQINEDIKHDLDDIIESINKEGIVYDSIYLIGGFGRGEGIVVFNGKRWRARNDYDLIIITSDCSKIGPRIKCMGKKLAHSLQVDFVDLGCISRASLPHLAPTMQNYDFKYGSLLLTGKDILHEVPDFRPAQLSPYEFVKLICNRAAGLLTARLPEHSQSQQYLVNQFFKACIAVGDILVYLVQGYHHLCKVRFKMFNTLVAKNSLSFELPNAGVEAIHKAYQVKLEGFSAITFSLDESLMQQMISRAYRAIAEHCTGKHLRTVFEAEWILRQYYCKSQHRSYKRCVMGAMRFLKHKDIGYIVGHENIKNWVLFAQPFFYCHPELGQLLCRLAYLRRFWLTPAVLDQRWNGLSAVKLWEKYFH